MKYRKVHKDMMFVEQPLMEAIEKEIELIGKIQNAGNMTRFNLRLHEEVRKHLENKKLYLEKCLEKFKAKMTAGDEL